MKIKEVELEKKDLVTILSDGTYGSDAISVDYPEETKALWEKIKSQMTDEERADVCWEDKLALILLAGGKLDLIDEYEDDEDENPHHIVGIEDFNRAACTEDGMYYMSQIANEEDDFYTGWNFLQIVMFGEVIYG